MKRFTHLNEGFTCENCQMVVPSAHRTCRNHCTECLCSLHVDIQPGDRASACRGLMKPVDVVFKGGVPVSLVHQCSRCNFIGKNKIADDDNREQIAQAMEVKGLC